MIFKSNNKELEKNISRVHLIYENNIATRDSILIKHYQEDASTYYQKTLLYNILNKEHRTILCIYNIENETKDAKILDISDSLDDCTCLTQLPDGKLFCFGNTFADSGITVLIDENSCIEKLPSGFPCGLSSTIYFKNNIYCFGGFNNFPVYIYLEDDLVGKRWTYLAQMPIAGFDCSVVIFNGNILDLIIVIFYYIPLILTLFRLFLMNLQHLKERF